MTADKRYVIQLHPATMVGVRAHRTLAEAAATVGVKRQAIHSAIYNASVCADYRWEWSDVYETRVALHGGVPLADLL